MADTDKRKHISVAKATQVIADSVNESLPVKITREDVEKTPEFVKLLKVLSQHLGADGVSEPVRCGLEEAEKSLQHQKQFWLQHHILHEELTELLLDSQLGAVPGATTGTASDPTQQFHAVVTECLLTAEIADFLVPRPDSRASLLGLRREDLVRRNPHCQHLPAIQQKLLPELENRLRGRCEAIGSFHDTAPTGESSGLVFARAAQLPAVLEAEKRQLQHNTRQLKRDRDARRAQFWHFYTTLLASLGVLRTLLQRHRLQLQTQCDTTTSTWLTTRCDAMCLKIKLLELQLMCDTYNAETVRALNAIKKEVSAATERTRADLVAAERTLAAYEAVGLGFDSLVHEYTFLKGEIENKKWALCELQPGETQA